jgi:hypothetical protein
MAAYTRKQYSGAARNTTTTTLLTNVGTTVDIAATTGWPSIAGIPFYVVINPSSIYEEKCLATISGSTLTLVRAQDDTTASEHQIGSVIYPVFTANDADEANELVSKLTTKGDLLVTDGTNLLRLGVGAEGYFLKASSSASAGVEWASIPTINSLNDIGDVTISDVEEGDFLVYKNSASAWINETIHFITVSDTEPTDEIRVGDLWYNSSELELYTYYSGSWIQVTLTPEFPTVEELNNVYISTASTGDVLAFDGLDWYNDTVSNLLGSHIIALSGDVSGSVLFDSSASVNISTTIQPNSVTLGTDTTGNYVNDLTAGTGVTITHTPGEGSSPTVAIGQAVGTSSSVQFAAVTAPLIGNSSTATTLENARTISLGGDVTGSVSFNGSSDVSITATIQPNSVALGTDTTGNSDNVTEGTTNLYFTDGRARTALLADNAGTASGIRFIAPNTGTVELISHEATRFVRVTSNAAAGGGKTEIQGSAEILASSSISDPGHLTVAGSVTVGGGVVFEGATANDYETFLVATDPTADRTITLPNADGTVALAGSIALGTDTTGNYMSDLTQGTGITITHTPGEGSNATIAIGQAVATSSSVSFARLETSGDVVVGGDLTVNGTTTTLNTETLLVEDNIVVLNSGITGLPTLNSGIEVERGTSANVVMRWNESADRWDFTNDGTTYNNVLLLSEIGQDSLNDTVITSPLNRQSLVYDGTNWVNEFASTVTYARNAEANALSVGEVVYLFGAAGDLASVKRASNSSEATSSKTVGVVSVGADSGANVTVTTLGYVSGIALGSYTAGDALWLGSTPGTFTVTKPVAPAHTVFVGVVARANSGNGIMYVKCQNGYEIEELHNVKINGVSDGQFLRYNSASTVWVNDSINLGTDTVGDYMLNVSAGTGIAISHTQGEGSTASVSTTGVQSLSAKAGNYTLASGDAAETIIIMDSSSANDLTVPSASVVAFGTGTSITVVQRGTGKTRILAGSGVTLLATPGVYLRARYSSCTLVKTENANEWFVIGDLAAS